MHWDVVSSQISATIGTPRSALYLMAILDFAQEISISVFGKSSIFNKWIISLFFWVHLVDITNQCSAFVFCGRTILCSYEQHLIRKFSSNFYAFLYFACYIAFYKNRLSNPLSLSFGCKGLDAKLLLRTWIAIQHFDPQWVFLLILPQKCTMEWWPCYLEHGTAFDRPSLCHFHQSSNAL